MANSNSLSEIQRLSALSDGIFAVAMTLLAYNVHLPTLFVQSPEAMFVLGGNTRLDLADDLIVMGLRTRERTAGIASTFNSSGTARAGSLPILDFDLCSVLARDDLETDVRTPAMELRLRFTLGRPFGQTMVWWQCRLHCQNEAMQATVARFRRDRSPCSALEPRGRSLTLVKSTVYRQACGIRE